MSLLTVNYSGSAMAQALPKPVGHGNPRIMLSEFGSEVETELIKALGNQTILPVGIIGTSGAQPFGVNARNRGSVELLLELISPVELDSEGVHELAVIMRRAVLDLFNTPRYQGGSYEQLEIISMVVVHRGVLVSKG